MKRPIRGYEFHIDTGTSKPIRCKQPRYGPLESKVIEKLVQELENKGIIEDDDGPYGSMIVLAGKPSQEHKHWSEYIFRLCVSYRQLNAITRPFTYPIIRCDDAVENIGNARVACTFDLDAGYWQVLIGKHSRPKTAFYTPEGKKRFKHLAMGLTNAHPFFVCMVNEMRVRWDRLYKNDKQQLVNKILEYVKQHVHDKERLTELLATAAEEQEDAPGAAVIVDDVILYARTISHLLAYLCAMLEVFTHHRVTIKLRKTRFLPARAKFVGVDVLPMGNTIAQSKHAAISQLCPPRTFGDWRMLMGFFGFYRNWIPWYEHLIGPWRDKCQQAQPRYESPDAELDDIKKHWGPEDNQLLAKLKQALLDEPILKRPDFKQRFFLKTDWSRLAMGAVLCQAEDPGEATGDPKECPYDKTLTGLRLQPVAFIAHRCKGRERDYHSYWGEAACGRWAMKKFHKYLSGAEFTWIADCSGLTGFLTISEVEPSHIIRRWQFELLRYNFTLVHRPEKMLTECNFLSRYNTKADEMREQYPGQPNPDDARFTGMTGLPVLFHKPRILHRETNELERTPMAEQCDRARGIWVFTPNRMAVTVKEGMTQIGLQALESNVTNQGYTSIEEQAQEITTNPLLRTEWVFCTRMQHISLQQVDKVCQVVRTVLKERMGRGAFLEWTPASSANHRKASIFLDWARSWIGETGRVWKQVYQNAEVGGATDTSHIIVTIHREPLRQREIGVSESTSIEDEIDIPAFGYDQYVPVIMETREGNKKTNGDPSQTEAKGTSIRQATIVEGTGRTHEVYRVTGTAPTPTHGETFIALEHELHRAAVRALTEADMRTLWGIAHPLSDVPQTRTSGKPGYHELTPANVWATVLAFIFQAESDLAVARLEQKWDTESTETTAEDPIPNRRNPEIDSHTAPDQFTYFGQSEQAHATLNTRVINRWTTYPLPTRQRWQASTRQDPDLKLILETTEDDPFPAKHQFEAKEYYVELVKGCLFHEGGIVYQTEAPAGRRIRQLVRTVVPKDLRRVVFTAYHASPLAGHTGVFKTYWRLAVRYFWPRMYQDIK